MIRSQNASLLKNFKASKPLFLAVIGAILLGASPIFVRLTDIGPVSTAFYRILFALPLLWLWDRLEVKQQSQQQTSPTRKEYALFALAGGFFALDLMMWHWALDLTSIVNAALFNNLTPFFVSLLVWILYAVKPTSRFTGAIIAALIGSALLTGESLQLDITHLWGDLLALFSSVAYSGYIIVLKHLRDRLTTSVIMLWTTFLNMLILLICAVLSGENLIPTTLNDWIGILSLAILVHVGGQGFLAYATGHLSAAFIALVLLIAPLVSALLGWVLMGERLGIFQLAGGSLVLVSIIIARQDKPGINLRSEKNKKESYATRT